MKPVRPPLLDELSFERAATDEAQAWRNLLPPEPWLEVVAEHAKDFGDYAKFRLETGADHAPSVVSRARKPHQQTRPVPVVGIPERIAYRALCDQVLAALPNSDRSQEAYRKFIAGPIGTAFTGKRFMKIADARIQYVVESDITAFYEYVDHTRLLHELQLRTSTVELPRHLIQLLTEVQERPFGLPQLLEPSDELSEIYARIVERELQRRGFAVWRYNDDFRIAAETYEEAQACVEALANEASAVGLVLNERKTRIIKFQKYFWKNWQESESEGDVEFKPELIKISSNYGELPDVELTKFAHETFTRLGSDPREPDHLDAKNLTQDEARDLGRAIGILTRQADPFGLPYVAELFEYVAHFSHRLSAYLIAIREENEDMRSVWDTLTARSDVFNAWQRLWLIHVARVGNLPITPDRLAWIASQRKDADPLLRAEATLTLAPHKGVDFDEVDRAVRAEPEALLAWYALAAKAIPNVNQKRLQALRESHKLIELLLPKRAKRTNK